MSEFNLNTNLDNLFNQIHKALDSKPEGAYYKPAPVAQTNNITPTGGQVAMTKRYRVNQRILTPNLGDRPVTETEWLEAGYVSESDLIERRCNIEFLIHNGSITEDGYMPL